MSLSSADRREVRLFDQLGEGAMIETSASSRAAIIFSTGERFSIEENTLAIIGKGTIKPSRGKVTSLPRAAGIPHILAISQADLPGQIQTAIRVRMNKEKEKGRYYPFSGVCVPADQAAVSFPAEREGSRYLVEVEDEAGKKIFSLPTVAATAAIPEGILKPGSHYYWSAKVVEQKKSKMLVHAFFHTLSEKEAAQRKSLVAQYEAGKEPDSLILLILSDCHMGLLREACAGIALLSDDETITRRLREILADFDCSKM